MHIRELKICTSNFSEQICFYSQKMGLVLIGKTNNEAKFKVGKSHLVFKKSIRSHPYHFAINIPSNKVNEALDWLKLRVEIQKNDGVEIQDFSAWNAKSIYFYDEDKNIVELIARKNNKADTTEPFNSGMFLKVSEIGVPVDDIKPTFNALREIVDIQIYDGDFERFCAIGDQAGMFICIDKNAKTWFPTGDEAYSSDFEIKFEEKGIEYNLEFSEGHLAKNRL
jgi:catechol 2,3-dioxygenase-like lactoylglutathione lyase family enzyme